MRAISMTTAMLGRMVVAILLVAAITASNISGQNEQPTASGPSRDELVPIENDGLWGYADREGKVIIKPQFSRAGRFSEGLALVWTGGVPLTDPIVKSFVKMGYIDKTGRWVIHSRFEYYFFDDFSYGLVPFRKQSSKWGFMDRTGRTVIQPRFDWAGSFSENAAPVLLGAKCAHVDKSGKVLDQSQTVLLHDKWKQDRHGTYLFKPHSPPCS
jgi:WG containing repeat